MASQVNRRRAAQRTRAKDRYCRCGHLKMEHYFSKECALVGCQCTEFVTWARIRRDPVKTEPEGE